MSYYKHTESTKPRRVTTRASTAKSWSHQPLTHAQKAKISIGARAAWDIHREVGLTTLDFEAWRHEETHVACGIASLREATNQHYRSIVGHFLKLQGKTKDAAALFQKTGRVKGSTEVSDTHENRETGLHLIQNFLKTTDEITWEYLLKITRDQFSTQDLNTLTAFQLQRLLFTLKARARAKKRKILFP